MPKFNYIDTNQQQQSVDAASLDEAKKAATNIDPHSGFQEVPNTVPPPIPPSPADLPLPPDPTLPQTPPLPPGTPTTPTDAQNQLTSIATAPEAPNVRQSSVLADQIKKSLETPAPTPPSSQATQFQTLRNDQGVSALEDELTGIDKEYQSALLDTQKKARDWKGRSVATAVINGKVTKITSDAKEALDALQARRDTVVNRLKMKNDTIGQIMSFTQQDYENASKTYNDQFSKAVTLYNVFRDEKKDEEATKDKKETAKNVEANRIRDDARANLQVLGKTMGDAGVTWDKVDPVQQANIQKLELQAGLPSGFYKGLLSITPHVDVTTFRTEKDGVTSIYATDKKTGKATLIQTVGTKNPGTSQSDKDLEKEEKKFTSFTNDAASLIEKLDKSDDITWSTAWDELHLKYPDASVELIDQTLGIKRRNN